MRVPLPMSSVASSNRRVLFPSKSEANVMRQARGFALIVVLWFLVLIAAIATYLLANARSETAVARNIRAAASAEALADAGIAQAIFNRTDTIPSRRWDLDGEPHEVSLATGNVTIRLYDEHLKINPNIASESLISGLFQAAGTDRALARRLGASIADWVGMGDTPRQFGAKKEQYEQAGRSYGPPNAPIESLDELQLVLGMTPELLALVRPYLTIYTSNAEPDETRSPPLIRRALALAQRDAKIEVERDAAAETAAGEMPAQMAPADKEAAAEQASNAEEDQKPAAPAKGGSSRNGDVLDLEITARSSDGGVFIRHAVVQLDPGSPKGYAVLDW